MASGLDLIRERLAAATPGPWGIDGMDNEHWGIRSVAGDQPIIASMAGYRSERTEADAEFIAHAPEDVRLLLAVAKAARNFDEIDSWLNRQALCAALAVLDAEEGHET